MSTKDTLAKDYMSNNERFADLFNFLLFNGEKVIKAEDLTVQDPTEVISLGEGAGLLQEQRPRDLLKNATLMKDDSCYYVLLGLENQSDIQYAMPVKALLYDVLNYGRQVKNISSNHKELRDIKGREFISGFSKTDKIIPIITLTVYWGSEEWDAPRCLHDMMVIPEGLEKFVNDYKLNLIIPREVADSDFEKLTTELRLVLSFLKTVNDPDATKQLVESDEGFKNVTGDTVNMLNIYGNAKFKRVKNQEVINVCDVFEEIEKMAKAEGKIEGKIEGAVEAVDRLTKDAGMTLQTACKFAGITPEEYESFKKIK